jgi:hypothetical protein
MAAENDEAETAGRLAKENGDGSTESSDEVAEDESTVEGVEEAAPSIVVGSARGLAFEFEGAADLDHVDALVERMHFGVSGAHLRPFTTQLKQAIRADFPVDNDIHDVADKAISDVQVAFLKMRTLTFLSFVAMAVVISSILRAGYPTISSVFIADGLPEVMSGWPGMHLHETIPLAYAGVAILIFTVLRSGIRGWYRREIEVNGEKFAFKVKSRYDDIMSKMDKCTRNALLETDHWPKRASLWTKIALWCAKRSEYLDRYATTVGWKAKDVLDLSEIFYVGGKVLVGLYVSLTIMATVSITDAGELQVDTSLYRIVFGAVLLPVLAYCWFFIDRFRNDVWTKKFASLVEDESAPAGNYFDDISGMVESFVRTISASRFNGGQGRG